MVKSDIGTPAQKPAKDRRITRRAFVSGIVTAGALYAQKEAGHRITGRPADIVLHIERAQIEVASGRTIATTTYNGTAPGPLIRMREGVTASVEVFNRTDVAEYVHWHGFEIPAELDGTPEEGSWEVPANGVLRYDITPLQAGSRYVHSHAMAMTDLFRGVYSGQFAFVYVEPRRNRGRYDQEIFLSTHEWEPRLMPEQNDESPRKIRTKPSSARWRFDMASVRSTGRRWTTVNRSA
jgi:FtsP/CotA-like multicopper oxidase with cupredoxin domain